MPRLHGMQYNSATASFWNKKNREYSFRLKNTIIGIFLADIGIFII